MKIKLTHDVYGIAKRIKNLDRGYFIVYDTEKEKFEVHNNLQLGSSYCLTLPYSELDARALDYVAKTSCTNIERILEEIESENRIQESADTSSALNQMNELVAEELKEK